MTAASAPRAHGPAGAPLRPLAQQAPRRTPDGVRFALVDRDVDVGGDPEAVWSVIGLCDGTRTVDEIVADSDIAAEDARALIDDLLAAGALVDCTQAYRLLHRQASAGSPMFNELDEEQLSALQAETFAPAVTRGDPVALRTLASPLLDTAAKRRSSFPGHERPVSFEELCTVLAATYAGAAPRRPVPSGGGLYPLAVHVAIRRPIGPLADGIWWLDPASGELQPTRHGAPDLTEVILYNELASTIVAANEPVAFVSADFERPSRKYANRGYRYALMEAGAAMQNAYLAAAELELPIRAIGGIHDRLAAELLDLDDRRAALLALLLGS